MVACLGAALLRGAKDSPRYRYLIALLNSRGLLVQALRRLSETDPGAAGSVANLAMRLVPGLERILARQSGDADGREAAETSGFEAAVLETVDAALQLLTPDAASGYPSDPKLRARLALLSGRAAGLWAQVTDFLTDADHRVRANAVEALWGQNNRLARESYESALADKHHRVRANALVGLYLMGEVRSLAGLLEMGRGPEPLARAAAAWAMARTGDPRFLGFLQELRRRNDRNPMVIRNALWGITRLQSSAVLQPAERLEIAFLCAERRESELRLHVAVRKKGTSQPVSVLPTQYHLSSAGEVVWDYRVEREPCSQRPLVLILPAGQESDQTAISRWRHVLARLPARLESAGGYAALIYGSGGEMPALEFHQHGENAAAALASPGPGEPMASGPWGMAASLSKQLAEVDLLLVLEGSAVTGPGSEALSTLRRQISDRNQRVFAVCSPDGPAPFPGALRELCRESHGWLLQTAGPDQIDDAVLTVAGALMGHDVVVTEERNVREGFQLRVASGRFTGEMPAAPANGLAAA